MDGDGARDQASATKRDSATRHFNYSSCAPSIQTSTQRSLYPLEWAQTSVLEMRSPISQSLVVGRPTDTFRNLHEGNLIDSLDLDILLMIFDLLLEDHPEIPDGKVLPAALRLTCKKWNKIATPHAYLNFKLFKALFSRKKPNRITNRTRRIILANIRRYSKHIRIDVDPYLPLNWNHVIRLLTKCKSLQTIRCHYHGADWHCLVFPRALHNAFLKNWPQVGLYFTIEKSTWQYSEYQCAFPTSNLVSLKSYSEVLMKHPQQFRKMLADNTRLEVLDLYTWYGFQFSMDGERLPPVKHLILRQYDWQHSPAAVVQIFDFSRLETFVLQPGHWWQDILPFLRSIRAEQFPQLKKLNIMNKQESTSTTSYGKEVNDLLGRLVANLPRLEDLTTKNFQSLFLVPAIMELPGDRLRTLNFMDCSSDHLTLEQLKALRDACVNLKEFRLPLGCADTETLDYFDLRLRVLCEFRSLEVLKIELFKFSRSFERARQRAKDMMEFVSQHKSTRLSKMHVFIALILGEGDTIDPEFVFTWFPEGLITCAEYVEQKAENLPAVDSDEDGDGDGEEGNDEEDEG